MRWDLVNKVLADLKGIIPYKENIVWEDFHATTYAGQYIPKQNKIRINAWLEDEETILNTIAHELIHSCGGKGHDKTFRYYMKIVNEANLGYNITILAILPKEIVNKRKELARWMISCPNCGFKRVYQKRLDLRLYRCSICNSKLEQKLV